jgi:hypothetical protein
MEAMLRARAAALLLPVLACTAPGADPDALRPAPPPDVEALVRAAEQAPGARPLAQATASSPDGSVLASCLAFPQGEGLLLVVSVTALSPDGQLSLRSVPQVRGAESPLPVAVLGRGYSVLAWPEGGAWGGVLAGRSMRLEYRAGP